MENKLTPELLEKTKEAKSVEELIALGKEESIELTEDEAKALLIKLNGELSDDELEAVSAGAGLNTVRCQRTKKMDELCTPILN